MRILITGASGCVGRYVVDAFLADGTDHLVCIVRDPSRLPVATEHGGRVTVVHADLTDEDAYAAALLDIDVAILVATSWGGEDVFSLTVATNLRLADALIAAGCRKILYFSSASVLARNGDLLPEAATIGTDYIKAKNQLVLGMEARAAQAQITGLFPTLILGGGRLSQDRPTSHFARLLFEVARWTWLMRFLRAEGWFHIIHARDIATVTQHLADGGTDDAPVCQRLVLGNPARSVDQMVETFCRHRGKRYQPVLPVTWRFASVLVRVFRIRLAEWDRYCMEHADQSYPDAVNPASYGLPVSMPGLEEGLEQIGLPGNRG